MKKLCYLLIVPLLFLVTGCSNVSYDLDIRLKSNYETLKFDYGDVIDMDKLLQENINGSLNLSQQPITYNIVNSKVELYNSFDNVEYLVDNDVIKAIYNNVDVSKGNNITTVKFSEYNNSSFECGEFDEECELVLDKITFNLTSEYEITYTNADLIDTKNNKYTWILDSESSDIYFSYGNKVLWNIVIKNYIKEHYDIIILTIVCISVLLSGVIMLIKFLKAIRENNS